MKNPEIKQRINHKDDHRRKIIDHISIERTTSNTIEKNQIMKSSPTTTSYIISGSIQPSQRLVGNANDGSCQRHSTVHKTENK